MRRTLGYLFGALVAAAAGFAPVDADAQTKVVIGTAKDPNLAAQIVVAREKGYFDAVGLEADIKYFPSGGDLLAAFVGGSVQFGSSGSTPTTILRSRPFPLVIVAQISDISGAQQIIAGPDVTHMADLRGKKIGLLKGTASEALFEAVIASQGMTSDQFEVVNLGPAEMVQAFQRRDVDAVALWEPHTTRARKLGNGRTLVSGTTSYFNGEEKAARVYGDHAVLFTSEAYLAENPTTVRMLLDALNQASAYIETNRQDAVAILAREFGLADSEMDDIVSVNDYTLAIDKTMIDDINALAAFLKTRGKIAAVENAGDWIDAEPLRAIAPALAAIP